MELIAISQVRKQMADAQTQVVNRLQDEIIELANITITQAAKQGASKTAFYNYMHDENYRMRLMGVLGQSGYEVTIIEDQIDGQNSHYISISWAE